MADLAEVLGRIHERLKAAGLTPSAASAKAGLSKDAIRNMERAVRGTAKRHGVSTRTIARLAPVLGTSPGYLLGENEHHEAEPDAARGLLVPIIGYVGAGAEAHYFAVEEGALDEVPAPEGATASTRAVEIRGKSLGRLFDRWIAFYDDVRRPITSDLIGHLCVVGLADGRTLIKEVRRNKSHGFDLLSEAGEPIKAVDIEWAARVKTIRPR